MAFEDEWAKQREQFLRDIADLDENHRKRLTNEFEALERRTFNQLDAARRRQAWLTTRERWVSAGLVSALVTMVLVVSGVWFIGLVALSVKIATYFGWLP
jgi:hypothetical protein